MPSPQANMIGSPEVMPESDQPKVLLGNVHTSPPSDEKKQVLQNSADTDKSVPVGKDIENDDGTSSLQKNRSYYSSKNFVLEGLKKQESKTSVGHASIASHAAELLVSNPMFSTDDAWLIGSRFVNLRNPYCVGNAPVSMQLDFWFKVSIWTTVYAFVVMVAAYAWTSLWLYLKNTGALKAVIPCKCSYCNNGFNPQETDPIMGDVLWCNATDSLTSSTCTPLSFINQCIPNECISSEEELQDCWTVTAFGLVVLTSYFFLLHRRDASGRLLLLLTCLVEGVLAAAGTLLWNTTVFIDFFVYHFFTVLIAASAICAFRSKWEKKLQMSLKSDANAAGHTGLSRTPAEKSVSQLIGWTLFVSFLIVAGIASILKLVYWSQSDSMKVEDPLGFLVSLVLFALTLLWLVFEGQRLPKQFCPDEPLHFVISLHVDMFCIVFFSTLYIMIYAGIAMQTGAVGMQTSCAKCWGDRKVDDDVEEDFSDDDFGDQSTEMTRNLMIQRRSIARRSSLMTDEKKNSISLAQSHTVSNQSLTEVGGQERTGFEKGEEDWKDVAKRRLVNLFGIFVIAGLCTLCFFNAEYAAFLCMLAMVGIPVSRYLLAHVTFTQQALPMLAGEWIDRSNRVHKVTLEGEVLLSHLLPSEGKRWLFLHTNGQMSLRAWRVPSLFADLKWSSGEEPFIKAVVWKNGDRWTPHSPELAVFQSRSKSELCGSS
eukprot:gnl/MRDRNA2_/MRDRNA2_83417_c0_seq1.p1 gnl/MRDRNA2_/MRDRNA2_83417_c0~~gnl/MRDRNA2_/MRDRNA2_83417_c0_seq1.p1  ORF type:complete len:709 (-),score=114.54 gnl/MRDRNA2_/MRDRNA2_83417_c0_seq1:231-2357(-)